MAFLRLTLRIVVFLPGALLTLVGMLLTLVGWAILTVGMALRIAGAILTGFFVVTRGALRFARSLS